MVIRQSVTYLLQKCIFFWGGGGGGSKFGAKAISPKIFEPFFKFNFNPTNAIKASRCLQTMT